MDERFDILSNMKKIKLISIGKNLKIKYLTQMKKEEIVDEILNKEFDRGRGPPIDIDIDDLKKSWICICEHLKHKTYCKECKIERERYKFYLKSVINDYCPFVEAMICVN